MRGARQKPSTALHAANRALGILDHAHLAPLHGQRVEKEQAPGERASSGREKLERLRRLCCPDDPDQRREYTHRRAACFFELVSFAEETVITGIGRIAQVEDGDLTVEADCRA